MRPCLIQNVVQNEKPFEELRRLILQTSKNKELSSFGFRPNTVNENKTNDDEELVAGLLENKYIGPYTAHNFKVAVGLMSKLKN